MEKSFTARSGYLFLVLEFIFLALAITGFISEIIVPSVMLLFLFILLAPGFIAVDPNQSYVLVLFGAYKGTLKDNGILLGESILRQEEIFASRTKL